MRKDELRFSVLRAELYDQIRFGGKISDVHLEDRSESMIRSERKLNTADFGIDVRDQIALDAYYEAVADLYSEGRIEFRDGNAYFKRHYQRSDRSRDAMDDHGRAHRKFKEEEIDDIPPRMCSFSELRSVFQANDSRSALPRVSEEASKFIVYDRVVLVDDSPWAVTYSVILGDDAVLTELQKREPAVGVFCALGCAGYKPVRRDESLIVRFPYVRERELLRLPANEWRSPVIVADGRVYANRSGRDFLIERYINIMRADRYSITSSMNLAVESSRATEE